MTSKTTIDIDHLHLQSVDTVPLVPIRFLSLWAGRAYGRSESSHGLINHLSNGTLLFEGACDMCGLSDFGLTVGGAT